MRFNNIDILLIEFWRSFTALWSHFERRVSEILAYFPPRPSAAYESTSWRLDSISSGAKMWFLDKNLSISVDFTENELGTTYTWQVGSTTN